jgi:hypothetical protein
MSYTTDTAVRGIIETDAAIDLSPFIDTAASLVEDICVPLGYSTAKLELIERWLAAHFYAIRDKRIESEKVGPLSEAKEKPKLDLALNNTTYGQQAMLVDTLGGLAAWNDQIVNGNTGAVSVTWLGTED